MADIKDMVRRIKKYNARLCVADIYVKQEIDKDFVFIEPVKQKVEDTLDALSDYINFLIKMNYSEGLGYKKKVLMGINTLLLTAIACDNTKPEHLKKLFQDIVKTFEKEEKAEAKKKARKITRQKKKVEFY